MESACDARGKCRLRLRATGVLALCNPWSIADLLALARDGRAALPDLRRECCPAWHMADVRLRLVRNGRIVPFAGARLFVCFTALVRRWEKELQ